MTAVMDREPTPMTGIRFPSARDSDLRRIGIIDDDQQVIDGLQRTLHQHRAEWLTSGFTAVDQALATHRSQPFDLFISDISMPGQTGFDLLQALEGLEGSETTPVIMLTGINDSRWRSRALEMGAMDLLCKPVDRTDLIARIRNTLRLVDYRCDLSRRNAMLEATIERIQRIEMVGLLASGSAHDLKNIFGNVYGLIDLSRMSPEEVWENLASMEQIIDAGMRLIHQILDLTRGRRSEEPDRCDPAATIRDMVALIRTSIAKAIDLVVDLPPCTPEVPLSRTALLQVIMNLVINSAQSIDGQGSITLTIRVEGEMVTITVADTGTGMTGEVRERIFDPLFSTKGDNRGVGIGLSLVKKIIDLAGGTIRVASNPGVGTTFTIALAQAGELESDPDDPGTGALS